MRRPILLTGFLCIAIIATAKVTTETLTQEYEQVQKRIAEDQQQLLRLEGAIRILEINAASTTSTITQTSATKTKN